MSSRPSLLTRIRRCGGLSMFTRLWIQNHCETLWKILLNAPGLSKFFNPFFTAAVLTSDISKKIPRIPHSNLDHDYVSMDSMYDESRTVYSRVLPRNPEYTKRLPPAADAASCFQRENFTPETNQNLTLLIAFYAQWFSHQFFNTNPQAVGHTNQPVGVNLSQLYGSTKEIERRQRACKDGLLKSSMWNGEEFPEIIETDKVTLAKGEHKIPGKYMFRIPIPLANLVPGFAAIHVVFFRHHQYVAREIKKASEANNTPLNDEEIYQKAKLIVIASMLRMTMEDYVAQSLQSSHIKLKFDLKVKDSKVFKFFGPKNFPPINAIQTEFNFLYRWHQFYPDKVKVLKSIPDKSEDKKSNQVLDINKYEYETLGFPDPDQSLGEEWNSVYWLTEKEGGLERLLLSAASQRAGKLTILNTHPWLVKHVVQPGIEKTRTYEMASYNDYREYFGFPRLKKFEEITDDPRLVAKLKSVYQSVDEIEYYVGIFAEEKEFAGIHGPLLANIGVGFTFNGIFASRLFETDLINEKTLTKRGMELIDEFKYMRDFIKAHTKLKNINARMEFTMPAEGSK